MEGNDRGDLRSGGVRRTQPQDEVQEGRESGEVGPDHGRGMEPQGPEQAKMDEDAGDGGDIDNQELGDNLSTVSQSGDAYITKINGLAVIVAPSGATITWLDDKNLRWYDIH